MVEEEATQEPSAGAPASASSETPVETPAPPQSAAEGEPAVSPADGEAPPAAAESDVVESPPRESPTLDWSHLRGFQTVEPPAEDVAARADYAEELTKELATRAARI